MCTAQQSASDGVLADTPAITVAMRSGGAAEIHGSLAKDGLKWPAIEDADGAISMRWGVSGVPSAFILDAEGMLIIMGVLPIVFGVSIG